MADGSKIMEGNPTEDISVRKIFGIDTDMIVKGFSERAARVLRLMRPINLIPTQH